MAKKSQDSFDLILYSVGLAFTFMVFLLSKWLSQPLMTEVESGASLVDIVFDGNDQVSFLWNLILPTFLMFLGIVILVGLLYQMVKSILLKQDTKLNKLLLILIIHVILIDLILTFKNGWQLLVLNFQYLIMVIVGLVVIGLILQYFLKAINKRTTKDT
ncbi:MAG TPA: hypothetical protein VNR38_16290 [Ureibacillus sp.]|nr:hypothetical protein [Ureibacillus sp.]